jgi:hypothetical protein
MTSIVIYFAHGKATYRTICKEIANAIKPYRFHATLLGDIQSLVNHREQTDRFAKHLHEALEDIKIDPHVNTHKQLELILEDYIACKKIILKQQKKIDEQDAENKRLWAHTAQLDKHTTMLIREQQRLFEEYTDAKHGEAYEQQD